MSVMVIDAPMMQEVVDKANGVWGGTTPEPHKLARAVCRHCIEAYSYIGGLSGAELMESAAEASALAINGAEVPSGWAHWADAVLLTCAWIWLLGHEGGVVIESWEGAVRKHPIADMALAATRALMEQYGVLERELDATLWASSARGLLLKDGMGCAAAMASASNIRWMLLLQCRLKRCAADVFNLNLGGGRL